eukprot:10403690-Alexandrium_andersonii.AAC.1
MSASLVGSEMCIRDRAHSEPPPRGSRTRGEIKSVCRPLHYGRLAPRAGTVSYTHLTLPTICSV